jgi:hydrophobic/amphiphilic exporter-1 (mainly G- bacteria), HAE1 family
MGIQKQSGANTVAVAEAVRREVERINAERDDVHLTVVADQSEFIRQSIASVRSSALWGSLLAVAVLYLFLRNRSSTAIIALSIPISVIATFGLLYFGGLTLNQMTFGGLALGVGLIVDNAIVVLESIVRKREEEGMAPAEAARTSGTREVAGAIVASTLTTCVIFLPVVFTRTTSGALFQALALVVVFALACSLLVALTLVPMLAARFLASSRRRSVSARAATALPPPRGRYTGRCAGAIRHRGRVFAATAGLLAAALLLWPLIPVELAPRTDADEIDVELEMAQGTNIAVVRAYLDELERKVRGIVPPTTSRWSRPRCAAAAPRSSSSSRRATAARSAAPRSPTGCGRGRRARCPGAEIDVDAQPGLWILRRVFSSGGGEDAPRDRAARLGPRPRRRLIAAEIRRRMERVPGRHRRAGEPPRGPARGERLLLDRERIAELGLSVREVGRTLQANVGGLEAGRFREGGDEFPIVVRLRPEDRLTAEDLRNVVLRTPPARRCRCRPRRAPSAAAGRSRSTASTASA